MIFIIVATLCWGLWGIFDKKALEKSSSQNVIIMQYLLRAVQIPILISILNQIAPGWHLSISVMFWSALASILSVVASVAYITAMSKTEASYVLGVTACYPVIAVGLAVLFLGEAVVLERILGAAVVCLGVYTISCPGFNKVGFLKLGKTVILCIVLAIAALSIWGIVDKQAVSIALPLEVCLGRYIWDLLILPVLLRIYTKQGHVIDIYNRRTLIYCILSAICLAFGAWAYLTAMSNFSASYVISMTASYPILMYFLAVIFLKERFNRLRFAGITLMVIGCVLVQNTQHAQAIAESRQANIQGFRQLQLACRISQAK